MGIYENLPYTNFHELNLEWLLKKVATMEEPGEAADRAEAAATAAATSAGEAADDASSAAGSAAAAAAALADAATKSELEAVADVVAALENANRDRCVLAIGDSYLLGSQNADPDNENWGHYMANALGLTDGVSYFHYGGSGYGFSKSEGYNLSELVTQAASYMTTAQKAKVTDVVIGAGANDWSTSQANFYDKITASFQSIKQTLNNQFPSDVKVHIVAMGWNCIYPRRRYLPEVYTYYAQRAAVNGWRYYETYPLLQNRPYFNQDGVHPTDTAQSMIGKSIANFILGSSFPVSIDARQTNMYLNGTVIGHAWIIGKSVVLHFMRVRITNPNTPAAVSSNQDIGTFECNYTLGGFVTGENNCYFTLTGIANDQTPANKETVQWIVVLGKSGDEVGRDTEMHMYVQTLSTLTHSPAPVLNTIRFDGQIVVLPFPMA